MKNKSKKSINSPLEVTKNSYTPLPFFSLGRKLRLLDTLSSSSCPFNRLPHHPRPPKLSRLRIWHQRTRLWKWILFRIQLDHKWKWSSTKTKTTTTSFQLEMSFRTHWNLLHSCVQRSRSSNKHELFQRRSIFKITKRKWISNSTFCLSSIPICQKEMELEQIRSRTVSFGLFKEKNYQS